MSRQNTTRLAVLGVVAVEPSSGYEIRQSIAESIGHFWSESFGQIYPTLKALDRDGYIELSHTEARNSKIYAITDTGLDHLRQLLVDDFTQPTPRDETLLRLFFGRFLGADGSIALLTDCLDASRAVLAELSTLRSELESQYAGSDDLVYWLLTVRSGELTIRARIEWATEAITVLEAARR